jgi:aspartate/methionine/tyrosine aminotransferase
MTEVMVTSGGTEALTSSILAVVEPGDEVVCFQPVYDSLPADHPPGRRHSRVWSA